MTGAEIKAWREQLGLTQEELAQKIGVTVTAVSRWERGKTGISKMSQRIIAQTKAKMDRKR